MKVRKIGLAQQMFVILLVLFIVGDTLLGVSLYVRTKNMLVSKIKENAKNTVSCAAQTVDAEAFGRIETEDKDFESVYDSLALFRDYGGVEYIYTLREQDGGVVFVVDTDPDEPGEIDEEYEYTDAMKEAFAGQVSVDDEPYTDEWGTHISAYAPIEQNGKVLGVATVDVSVNDVKAQTRKIAILIVGVCSVVLVLLVITLLFISNKLRRGFLTLDHKIKDLTDGNGDLTKEIHIRSGDEFEVISGHINDFIIEIRELVNHVAGSSDEILNSSESLNETLEENTRIITKITDEVTSLSATMEECSASSESASENLSGGARQLQELAEEVKQVQKFVLQTHREAEGAKEHAAANQRAAFEQIEEIQKAVNIATEDAKKIEKINDIAERITGIAKQTGLLSLNAQIEAARAGEQGRGFAVVATSVSELSDEITQAVAEINEINQQALASVVNLNQSVNEMNRFMTENVAEDYNAFVQLGEDYGKTTEQIKADMERLQAQSQEISSIVSGIDRNISDINVAIGESAQQTESLSDEVSNISASMDNLADISSENEMQSEKMNEQIRKYKY